MFFASDNGAAAHPNILQAVIDANAGYASAYGSDALMLKVTKKIREIFEAPDASVYLVATGTAANALSLACITEPWQTSFCHRLAHVEEDECGAPEFFTGGAKLTLIDGNDGKIDADAFAHAVRMTGRTGVHNVQRGSLSITQVTETGTVYSLDEINALVKIAKDAGIKIHLDGARFANALVALGCTPAELTWKSGVDILSFGGTKNGCMGVEAVIIFDPEKAWEFELRRKRAGHLFSKHRYLSAQMLAYLEDDLWLELARHANDMASGLSTGLSMVPGASLLYPQDANMIFANLKRSTHQALAAAEAKYYHWPIDEPLDGDPEEVISCRLVCSWQTETSDVDQFLSSCNGES